MTTISEKKLIRFGEDFEKLKKENEELKQEYERLRQESHKLLGKFICRDIRIDKLIKEKKELKEKITMQSYDEDFMNHEMKIIWDENVKLIEELKLKDEIIRLHETS